MAKIQFNKTYPLIFTPFFYFLQAFVIRVFILPFYYSVFKIRVLDRKNLPPKEQKIILAPNHLSNFDPPLIAITVLRPVIFLGKKELFKVPILNYVIYFLGTLEVDREQLKVSTIKSAKELVKNERWLCIFPEGTRNKTNNLIGDTHKGFATLAKATGSKILPIGIHNSNKLFSCVTVRVGTPYDVEDIDEAVERWKREIVTLIEDHDE